MRTISANGLLELAKNLGTEPVIIIDIQWTEGGSIQSYGDIESEGVTGTIQEVSGLDNIITISGVSQGTTGESAQLSVILSDIDNSIKNIIDQNDIHKRPCWVYQWFPNLSASDRFLLFKGQISSPIEWHEGDRTVRFDIINQIEDAEVGFSVEEGNILLAPDDLIGKPWPLVFGTCIHIPALRIREQASGILQQGFGIHDFTIACKLDQLNRINCPTQFVGFKISGLPGAGSTQKAVASYELEPGCVCRKLQQKNQWLADLALQYSYERSTLNIIGGETFPQGEYLTLDICGAKVFGKFAGSVFTVSSYTHPENTACPPTINFPSYQIPADEKNTAVSSFGTTTVGICTETSPEDRTGLGWDYLTTFPTADFFWAEPGCEVFIDGNAEIVYVVNLLPSTIHRVAAYRTFEGGRRELVTVPSSLYTARVSDFNGYMVTELVLTRELSRRNEGWEDEIFVSQTSSVGPNTVDILDWLITKYTNFSVDAASFADVRTKIDNYPSSFPLLERSNVLDVLRDIAFQARCALYLRNDEFIIKYLSEEPASDFTINETDVYPKTLILTHTETEELVTKLVASWREDYAIDSVNNVILRYNAKRYGTQQKEFNFFIYNIRELVEKSATFWLIRMANTWRKLKLHTPITKLQAEVFDVASVSLSDFSSNTIKCIVEKASYNSENHSIEFELWTPVRAGSTEQFVFSWPAEIEIDNIWPTLEDQELGNAGGSGPNVAVTAPALHPLNTASGLTQGFTYDDSTKSNCTRVAGAISNIVSINCRNDHGDKRPSDKDDEKPTKKVPGQGETDIPTSKNPTGAATSDTRWKNTETLQKEADEANQVAQNEEARDGGAGKESGNPPDEPIDALSCQDDPSNCNIIVTWSVATVISVNDGGPNSDPSAFGHPVFFADDAEPHSMLLNSLEAAYSIEAALDPSVETNPGTSAVIPGSANVPVGGINGIAAWYANACQEPEEVEVTSFCGSNKESGTKALENV